MSAKLYDAVSEAVYAGREQSIYVPLRKFEESRLFRLAGILEKYGVSTLAILEKRLKNEKKLKYEIKGAR